MSEQATTTVSQLLSEALSATRYACTSLARLTNGTTNFVFRGQLAQPIIVEEDEDGNAVVTATTVIVKYTAGHAALNKNFPIDASRALYEESMLAALNGGFSSSTSTSASTSAGVKAPRLYLFLRDASIQVLEDFQGTTDLKNMIVAKQNSASANFSADVAASVGFRMGSWLRQFHDWSSADMLLLAEKIGTNEPMRKLKFDITYGSVLKILGDNFPELLEGHDYRSTLEEVVGAATKEFGAVIPQDENRKGVKNWGLIHGDFWSGNVLLPNIALSTKSDLFIVDWEFTQFGHRAYDIGQMVGDLFERMHFEGTRAQGAAGTAADRVLDGFIRGYGVSDPELGFRVAVHAGVQLMGWFIRRAPGSPYGYPDETVKSAVRIARDWMVHGWRRDVSFFDDTPLAGLFVREEKKDAGGG